MKIINVVVALIMLVYLGIFSYSCHAAMTCCGSEYEELKLLFNSDEICAPLASCEFLNSHPQIPIDIFIGVLDMASIAKHTLNKLREYKYIYTLSPQGHFEKQGHRVLRVRFVDYYSDLWFKAKLFEIHLTHKDVKKFLEDKFRHDLSLSVFYQTMVLLYNEAEKCSHCRSAIFKFVK